MGYPHEIVRDADGGVLVKCGYNGEGASCDPLVRKGSQMKDEGTPHRPFTGFLPEMQKETARKS